MVAVVSVKILVPLKKRVRWTKKKKNKNNFIIIIINIITKKKQVDTDYFFFFYLYDKTYSGKRQITNDFTTDKYTSMISPYDILRIRTHDRKSNAAYIYGKMPYLHSRHKNVVLRRKAEFRKKKNTRAHIHTHTHM